MKVNAKLAGWRMSSIGPAVATLLIMGWGLAPTCTAQTQGAVAVSQGSDGEYIFNLSAAATADGDDFFVFEFPTLWAETIQGPDFSGSIFCSEGCNHAWIQSGDTIRGIEIQLPSMVTDSGHMAQVVGWPIIDNIDFKVQQAGEAPSTPALSVAAIDQGLQIDCVVARGMAAHIEVWDLQGRLCRQTLKISGQPSVLITGLHPGIYLVQCYADGQCARKKVCVLR